MVAVAGLAVDLGEVRGLLVDGIADGERDGGAAGIGDGGAHALAGGLDLGGCVLDDLCGLDGGGGGGCGDGLGDGHAAELGEAVALDGHVDAGLELVVELHDGKGDAVHLERGEVVAHVGLVDGDALLLDEVVDLGEEDVLLHDGGGTEAGDQHDDLVAGDEGKVGQDDVDHLLGHLVGALERLDADARLAVVADADLHGARLDVEVGLAVGGDGAGAEADAHRAGVVDGLLGAGDDLVEAAAHGGLGTAALPHHDLAGNAAALGAVDGVGGNVVVGDDEADSDAVLLDGALGHLDVHVVTGVVAVEHGHAEALVDGADALLERLGGGAGEDLAHGHGIDHVAAAVADEGGLVARAAAGDDADLGLLVK